MPESAHIFFDTNIALHYRRADQIDWKKLCGTSQIVLVAAPIFLRELELQKVHNQSKKLRTRATEYAKWIVQFIRDPNLTVSPGVAWRFLADEPAIDFAAHKLSPSIADDQLIASVLAYSSSDDIAVFVATADIGVELKLRSRQIEPLLLPDDCRLPDEPDPQEKELLGLRRQLAQQRIPRLALITEDSSGRHKLGIRPQVVVPSAPTIAELRQKNQPILIESPDQASSPAVFAGFDVGRLRSQTADSYNKRLEKFFEDYQAFLDELLLWEEQFALSTALKLSLSNDGTAPATDVDLVLTFPPDLIVMDEDSFPKQPKAPKPPDRPGVLSGLLGFDIERANFNADYLMRPPRGVHRSVSVERSGRVNYWIKNFKHGGAEELEFVCFQFPDRQAVRAFHADYEISAAELPEAIPGQLHFLMPDEPAGD